MTDGAGFVLVTKSEEIDLSELGNYQCFDWVDYPIDVIAATGGLLGSHPVVCGGHDVYGYQHVDECYKITAKKADKNQNFA